MRKVVNITRSPALTAAGQAGYLSGKAAIGLTKTLSKSGDATTSTNAGFGIIETRLVQPLGDRDAHIVMHDRQIGIGVHPSLLNRRGWRCPLGRQGRRKKRRGRPFFCSPLSDYVTGEVLICGGGYHF
jgi:3-oxoacyl-[acyl-carrier protein] reductase